MKIFISYAHENPEHDSRVEQIAMALRQHDLDCESDHQFADAIGPAEGWPDWSEREILKADRIIIVCSPAYKRRWEGTESPGTGRGAAWEAKLIRMILFGGQKDDKFITVVLSKEDVSLIPERLQGRYKVIETDEDLEQFCRALLPPVEPLEAQKELARKYLPAWSKGDHLTEEDFGHWSALFSQVVDPVTPRGDDFLQAFARRVLSSSVELVRVEGESGTGKTTLLATFYFYLRSRFEAGQGALPLFLHLGEYDDLPPEEAVQKCQRDLEQLTKLIGAHTDRDPILLVDGFDSYLGFRSGVEDEVLRYTRPRLKKIVGVGLGLEATDRAFRFSWGRSWAITLSALSPDPESVQGLVDAFLATTPQASDGEFRKGFLERLTALGLSQIDLRSLALVLHFWDQPGDLSELLRCYCRAVLAPASYGDDDEVLGSAATLAYAHAYLDEEPSPDQGNNLEWVLIHQNVDVRDYLIAYRVIGSLFEAGGSNQTILSRQIYPHWITRHAKAILNRSVQEEYRAVEAARGSLDSQDVYLCTNVSYFLGRLTDPGARQRATALLQALKQRLSARDDVQEGKVDRNTLRLLRTIYVSLIYLGNRKASNEYIDQLLAHEAWDHLNRGFHLEYYGDIVKDRRSEFTHEDTMVDFPRTFRRLRSNVEKHWSTGDPIAELEIYTLFSLAQCRHAAGLLDPAKLQALLPLLQRTLDRSLASPDLRRYLRMLQVNFEKKKFSAAAIVEDWYKIKETPRSGWIARGLKDTESVADHMYGAFLLGLLFLPEKSDTSDYDKRIVLETVLIHDLAETYTTDILSTEKTQRDREIETGWFEYIGLLGTYADLADLRRVEKLWQEYEKESTLNGRIAKDLDHLDAYVQMHLYSRRGEVRDLVKWQQEIARGILTSEGQRILDLLAKRFAGSATATPDENLAPMTLETALIPS